MVISQFSRRVIKESDINSIQSERIAIYKKWEEFAIKNIHNISTFPPCDVDSAIIAIEELSISLSDRTDFTKKYSQEKIMVKMAKEVLDLIS